MALIAYESPFAPCGGIAAVLGRLPGAMAEAAGVETVVMTPFHHHLMGPARLDLETLGSISVPYEGQDLPIEILRRRRDPVWCFVKPAASLFFAGRRHPYDVGETSAALRKNLLRDALLFGVAVPQALALLDGERNENWTLLLQDWEAATVALALAALAVPRAPRHRLFLTLHNSYDSGEVSDALLGRFGLDPVVIPGPPAARRATVLERALPLIDERIFTVSRQFARDLLADPLQTRVMAPHLQRWLPGRIRGVDNGLFASLQVPESELAEARRGRPRMLRRWKRARKEAAAQALTELAPSEATPVWGDRDLFLQDDLPWLIFAGRDDTRQKGYDVAVEAMIRFLASGGRAKFLFFPIPGDEGLGGLDFLRSAAAAYPRLVLALPFIWKEGFGAALQGAAFGVMPSFYEPFGMANEFYLQGTVGIGRATGGLLQQIVPWRGTGLAEDDVQRLASDWHAEDAVPTGFLYRERAGLQSVVEDWRCINAAEYGPAGKTENRLQARSRLSLFGSMAESLQRCLAEALRIHQLEPDLHDRMLVAGIDHLQANFSWSKAARTYLDAAA
jgi:glycogen synthase